MERQRPRARGDARLPPSGRARRAPPAGRSGARGDRPRAPRARRRERGGAHSSAPSSASSRRLTPARRRRSRRGSRPPRRRDGRGRRARSGSRAQKRPGGARRRAGGRRAPRAPPYVTTSPHASDARRGEQLALERRSSPSTRRTTARRRTRPRVAAEVRPRNAGTDPARSRHAPVTGWPLACHQGRSLPLGARFGRGERPALPRRELVGDEDGRRAPGARRRPSPATA